MTAIEKKITELPVLPTLSGSMVIPVVRGGTTYQATVSFNATNISVDASGFDGNLATTDDTVQKVAQKLDDLKQGFELMLDLSVTETVSTIHITRDKNNDLFNVPAGKMVRIVSTLIAEGTTDRLCFFKVNESNMTWATVLETSAGARYPSAAGIRLMAISELVLNQGIIHGWVGGQSIQHAGTVTNSTHNIMTRGAVETNINSFRFTLLSGNIISGSNIKIYVEK
jgi:hypothetical protein